MTVKLKMKATEKSTAPRRVRKSAPSRDEPALAIDEVTAREIVARLARVEGQVRAVARMIDERRDCHAIVLQLGAARAALQRATAHLMVSNLAECIRATNNGTDAAGIQDLTDTFIKLL
jgi:DNA-binding FrmR family transcriptional regulator